MNAQPLVTALTGLNVAALLFHLATCSSATSPVEQPVIRARAIELVDVRGQVRAQLSVEADGEAVFRMRDGTGAIRVKLGASEDGSGLVLLNESTEPGVRLLAEREGEASLTLEGQAGRQRVITPR